MMDHPFVVHHHQVSKKEGHYDLMLERGGVLKTWRLSPEAIRQAGKKAAWEVALDPIQDHRLRYLTYEGPVSRHRGIVRLWDKGVYEERLWSDQRIEITLAGGKLKGDFRLTRTQDGVVLKRLGKKSRRRRISGRS